MFGCFLGIDGAIGGFSSSTPTFTVSITGLTANPTFGQTAEIGTTITAVAQGFSGNEPATIAYQWQKDGADIAGATSDTYSPSAPDDLVALTCRVSPDGYAPRTSSA